MNEQEVADLFTETIATLADANSVTIQDVVDVFQKLLDSTSEVAERFVAANVVEPVLALLGGSDPAIELAQQFLIGFTMGQIVANKDKAAV